MQKLKPGDKVEHESFGEGIFIEYKDCDYLGIVFCADDGVEAVPENECLFVGHRPEINIEYGEWSWEENDSNFTLLTPYREHAAIIYKSSKAWYVLDPNGFCGQNDIGRDIEDAKWCALHAAKVLWYEKGWIKPG